MKLKITFKLSFGDPYSFFAVFQRHGSKEKTTNSQEFASNNASKSPAKRRKSAPPSDDANQININYDLLAEAILRKQQTINVGASNEPFIQTIPDQDSQIDVAGPSDSLDSQPALEASSSSATATTSMPSTVCNHTNQFSSLLHDFFAGELGANNKTTQVNPPSSIDEGISLGANTLFRIKQKIWFDQFFDLRSLLPNHKESLSPYKSNKAP